MMWKLIHIGVCLTCTVIVYYIFDSSPLYSLLVVDENIVATGDDDGFLKVQVHFISSHL